jgi:hypothetical protein
MVFLSNNQNVLNHEKNIFFSLLIGIFLNSREQTPCNPDSFPNIKGKWIDMGNAISGATAYGLTTSQVNVLLKKMDQYQELITKWNPQPLSVDIRKHKFIGEEPLFNGGPMPFEIKNYINQYVCSIGIWKKTVAAGCELTIRGNSFFGYISTTAYTFKGKNILALPHQLGMLHQLPLSQDGTVMDISGKGESLNSFNNCVLICKPGMLPYIYLTRKDVLDYFDTQCEIENKSSLETIAKLNRIRPKSEQDAEKQKEMDYYKKTFPDNPRRLQRYLEDYRTDEQKLEIQKQKSEVGYKVIRDRIQYLRNKYQNSLNETAIVDPTKFALVYDFKNWDFLEDIPANHPLVCNRDCRHGNRLAILNEAYFDKKLPHNVPQFFVVRLDWTTANKGEYRSLVYEKIFEDWKSKFDFKGLSAFLDK